MKPNLNRVLAIYVITFNRSKKLIKTLCDLNNSVFAQCEITVLDNCSTDDTEESFFQNFGNHNNFVYAKNYVNIGGSGNVIQAFQISRKFYTWIVCDDDNLNFELTGDVQNQIITQTADLIQIGGHFSEIRYGAGVMASPKELIATGYNYFRDCSFLPSTIYRTGLVHENLSRCYSYCNFMYPHMAIIMAAYDGNLNVYISIKPIVTPSIGTQSYSRGEHLECWYNLAMTTNCISTQKQILASQWMGGGDKTGIIRLIVTAIRFRKYLIALKILIKFNINVLKSLFLLIFNYARIKFF